MVNTNGAADLSAEFRKLSTAEREALAIKGDGSQPVKPIVHAFAVVILGNGQAIALPDASKLDAYDHLPATVEEIFNGCNAVGSDLQASKTAQIVGMQLSMQAQAAMNSAQNQEIMDKLRREGQI